MTTTELAALTADRPDRDEPAGGLPVVRYTLEGVEEMPPVRPMQVRRISDREAAGVLVAVCLLLGAAFLAGLGFYANFSL